MLNSIHLVFYFLTHINAFLAQILLLVPHFVLSSRSIFQCYRIQCYRLRRISNLKNLHPMNSNLISRSLGPQIPPPPPILLLCNIFCLFCFKSFASSFILALIFFLCLFYVQKKGAGNFEYGNIENREIEKMGTSKITSKTGTSKK